MSYVLLWLEAPLQSWGADSKYGRCKTMPFPTKSGILGLILSAMGKGGEQRDLLSRFATTDLQIECFPSDDKKFVSELKDYHVVGSAYNASDPWEKLLIPKTSEGKKAVGGGHKITYRYYLQNMAFAAFLEVPDDLISEVEKKLKNPVWSMFLGRKNCVPSEIVFQGVFDTATECSEEALSIAKEKNRYKRSTVYQKADEREGVVFTLNDVPIQFGERKIYADRQVTLVMTRDNAENLS